MGKHSSNHRRKHAAKKHGQIKLLATFSILFTITFHLGIEISIAPIELHYDIYFVLDKDFSK